MCGIVTANDEDDGHCYVESQDGRRCEHPSNNNNHFHWQGRWKYQPWLWKKTNVVLYNLYTLPVEPYSLQQHQRQQVARPKESHSGMPCLEEAKIPISKPWSTHTSCLVCLLLCCCLPIQRREKGLTGVVGILVHLPRHHHHQQHNSSNISSSSGGRLDRVVVVLVVRLLINRDKKR